MPRDMRIRVLLVTISMALILFGCMPPENGQGPEFIEFLEARFTQQGKNVVVTTRQAYQGISLRFQYPQQGLGMQGVEGYLSIQQTQGNNYLIAVAGKPQPIPTGTPVARIVNANLSQFQGIQIQALGPMPTPTTERAQSNPRLLGDFDQNGTVEMADFNLFKARFGTETGDAMYDPAFDIGPAQLGTGAWAAIYATALPDGRIDIYDLTVLGRNFGQTIPEDPVLPTIPTLIQPLDEAQDVSRTPLMQWNASTDPQGLPIRYDLYLNTTGQWDTPFVPGLEDTVFTPETPLEPATTYFWRVVAISDSGSATSHTRSFKTLPLPPTSPSLVNPEDQSEGQELDLVFQWEAADHATSYDLLLGTAPTPTTVVRSGLTATQTTLEDILGYSTTYYWKVIARNASGNSESGIWSFSTTNVPVDPPGPFNLEQPLNQTQNTPLNTTLRWGASERATSYQVYFGTDENPPLVSSVSTPLYSPTLLPNTTYYWRVVAKNASGETLSNASETPWQFTTVTPPTTETLLRDLGPEGSLSVPGNVYYIADDTWMGVWSVSIRISALPDEFRNASGWLLTVNGQAIHFMQNIFDSDIYELSIDENWVSDEEEIKNSVFSSY